MKFVVCGSLLLVAVISYAYAEQLPPQQQPYGVASHVASFNFDGKWKGKVDVGKDKNGVYQIKPEADKNNYYKSDWGYESKFEPYQPPGTVPAPGEKPASQETASDRPKKEKSWFGW